jgi:hypothetical protein
MPLVPKPKQAGREAKILPSYWLIQAMAGEKKKPRAPEGWVWLKRLLVSR